MKKTKKYRSILTLVTTVFAALLIFYMVYDISKEIGSGYVPSNVKPIIFLVTTLYVSFSFWYYKKKFLLVVFLLIIATLFYFYTYGWQYMEFTGFFTHIEGLDCKNYNIYDVYSSIDFNESNKAIVYQEISFSTHNFSTNHLTFYMPQGLIGYVLSMNGDYYNSSIRDMESKNLFYYANFTRPDGYRYIPNISTYDNGNYKITAYYYIENITPYGNFQFSYNYNSENCPNSIASINYGVSFGDIVYECAQPCMVTFNPNATRNDFWMPFIYADNTRVRPSITLAANEKNVNSIGFRLQTINKFFVMARLLSLSLISGLILTFIKLIIDEPDYSRYISSINRCWASIRNIRNVLNHILTAIWSYIIKFYLYLKSALCFIISFMKSNIGKFHKYLKSLIKK